MTQDMSRDEQLIAAATTGELTEAERLELQQRCAEDPRVARDLDEMLALVGRIDRAGLSWVEASPDPALEDAVVRATGAEDAGEPRRPRVRLAAAAAVLLIAGAGVGVGADRLLEPSPPTGPAGTLGAVEQVTATTEVPGASVDVSLVAHTWGTETILSVDGFDEGTAYDVVLLDRSGRKVESGAFLGSAVTIDCSLNAAVMRADVQGIEIVRADGTVVVDAEVPPIPS